MVDVQRFESGATRNDDSAKFDYEGFLNPEALHAFGEYMHEHRIQRDGSMRDADNWQKGIPFRKYLKSLVRHVFDLWRMDRGYEVVNPDTGTPHTKRELCCAIVFNAMGYLKELVDPAAINATVQPVSEVFATRNMSGPGCPSRASNAMRWSCERPEGHTGDHMAWRHYPDTLYEDGRWADPAPKSDHCPFNAAKGGSKL